MLLFYILLSFYIFFFLFFICILCYQLQFSAAYHCFNAICMYRLLVNCRVHATIREIYESRASTRARVRGISRISRSRGSRASFTANASERIPRVTQRMLFQNSLRKVFLQDERVDCFPRCRHIYAENCKFLIHSEILLHTIFIMTTCTVRN